MLNDKWLSQMKRYNQWGSSQGGFVSSVVPL